MEETTESPAVAEAPATDTAPVEASEPVESAEPPAEARRTCCHLRKFRMGRMGWKARVLSGRCARVGRED